MKVNREKLEWYLKNIRRDNENISDTELINKLATWIERNPGCIDVNGVSDPGRYYYSTVGYGVFSLLGERYRMGRIEVFDSQSESDYQIDEGSYCMPFVAANQFEDFIESLQTDLPIHIGMGSVDECNRATAEELGIEPDKMHDKETKKEFYKKKNDISAKEQGYKDWDDLLAHSKFGPKNKDNDTNTTKSK